MANRVVHFEVGCRDQAATAAFYSAMFGWAVDQAFQIGAETAGLTGHFTALGHEPYNYTIFYVEVEDVAAAASKAQQLGGKLLVGPIQIPAGIFAWVQDTAGNTLGLVKRTAKA
jgi:predicted enzyme related to lactoylglutathione lyase